MSWLGIETATESRKLQVQCPNHYTTEPAVCTVTKLWLYKEQIIRQSFIVMAGVKGQWPTASHQLLSADWQSCSVILESSLNMLLSSLYICNLQMSDVFDMLFPFYLFFLFKTNVTFTILYIYNN